MFEKLLALILHSKSALLAGVFVAGTTGLLITGTVTPEQVNLTLTPVTASGSPTGSPYTVVLSRNSESPTSATTSPHKGKEQACADQAHIRNGFIKDLHTAWEKARKSLAALRKDARSKHLRPDQVEKVLHEAREAIDDARQDAQKAIHEAVSFRHDDDDNDKDNDNDEDDLKQSPGSGTVSAHPKPCPTVDKTKLAKIVAIATGQMTDAVNAATTQLATLSPATPKSKEQNKDKKRQDGKPTDNND